MMKTKTPPGRIQAGWSNTNVGDTMRVKDMAKIEKNCIFAVVQFCFFVDVVISRLR